MPKVKVKSKKAEVQDQLAAKNDAFIPLENIEEFVDSNNKDDVMIAVMEMVKNIRERLRCF